jgi:hypothetical protein
MKKTLAAIGISALLAIGLLVYGLSVAIPVLAQNGPYNPCGNLPPTLCSPLPPR